MGKDTMENEINDIKIVLEYILRMQRAQRLSEADYLVLEQAIQNLGLKI